MKAQLVFSQDSLYLLLCSGKNEKISEEVAKEFLLSYDDSKYYSGPAELNFNDFIMEPYQGTTIAIVDDNDILHVFNSKQFRHIFTGKELKLLTVPEYAALHGKKNSIIRRLCLEGRIKGAIQKGSRWLIPEDSPYPEREG